MIGILHRLEGFVGLVLLQVLVLNQMHIGGYATPFFYIYFLLKLDTRVGRNELMLWAFAIGLTVDMFTNTPGMNAAATTCLAFFRGTLLRMVTLRDLEEGFSPGIKTLGFSSFFRYSLLACSLFCILLQLMNVFSFFDVTDLLLKMVTSTFSTLLLVLGVEFIGRKKA